MFSSFQKAAVLAASLGFVYVLPGCGSNEPQVVQPTETFHEDVDVQKEKEARRQQDMKEEI